MSLLPTPLRDLKVNPTEEGENYREPSADVGGAPGGGSGLTPGPRAGGSQPGWGKNVKDSHVWSWVSTPALPDAQPGSPVSQ